MTDDRKTLLHITLLAAVAVSRPLLAIFEQQPEALIAHGLTQGRLVVFTLLLAIALPVTTAGCVALVRVVSKPLAGGLAFVLITALFCLIVAQVVIRLLPEISATVFVIAAISGGLALTLLRQNNETTRLFLTYLSPALLVFPLFFLWVSPARNLVTFSASNNADAVSITQLQTPVVLIVFDEFPISVLMTEEMQLNGHRFPNFDRLAKTGTWYRYATSNAEATVLAIPTLLSGQAIDPENRRLPVASQYPETLFSMLADTHKLHVHESVTQLCPTDLCVSSEIDSASSANLLSDLQIIFRYVVTPKALRSSLPSLQGQWSGFGEPAPQETSASTPTSTQALLAKANFGQRQTQFLDFVDAMGSYPPATLHYVHVLVPHAPFYYDEQGKTYALPDDRGIVGEMADDDPGASQPHQWHPDQTAVTHAMQRLTLQVGAVDRLLGQALDSLVESNQFNDAMIIVIGDHGSHYRLPGSRRELSRDSFAAIAGVPLIIKYPNQVTGKVSDLPAQTQDVLPTIVKALGGQTPLESYDGQSLEDESVFLRSEVSSFNDGYQQFTMKFDEYQASLRTLVKRQRKTIANGGWDRVTQVGPYPGLLGRKLSEVSTQRSDRQIATLLDAPVWNHVDLNASFVPRLVRGSVATDEVRDIDIAITVNGVIAATAIPFTSPDARGEFAALIDTEHLTNGRNSIELFEVVDSDGKLQLQGSDRTPLGEPYLAEDSKVLVLGSSERPIDIGTGQPWGDARLSQNAESNVLTVRGWSGNTLTGRKAERVMMFADTRLAAETRPDRNSADVAKRYGWLSLEQAGYWLQAPANQLLGNDGTATLRIVALDSQNNARLLGKLELSGFADSRNISAGESAPYNFDAILQTQLARDAKPPMAYETLDLADPINERYLMGHWHKPSGNIRWGGDEFSVAIPGSTVAACATFNLLPLLGDGLSAQEVEIYASSTKLRAVTIDQNGGQPLAIDLPARANQNFYPLTFRASTAARPVDLGTNGDVRLLSLGFSRLRVTQNECR